MPVGLNGQPVLSGWDDPLLVTVPVAGTSARLTVRRGWYQRVAAHVAWRWSREVEPLVRAECYGFDYRPARAGGGAWSSHSTGYAIDLNSNHAGAQLWGDSKLKATDAQLRAMARIKQDTGLLWGGPRWAGGDYGPSDYDNGQWVHADKAQFVDPMHWDLPKGLDDPETWLRTMCERLRIAPDGTTLGPSTDLPLVSLTRLNRHQYREVRLVKIALSALGYRGILIDGKWDASTQAAYDAFRRDRLGLTGDAATGPPGLSSLSQLGVQAGARGFRTVG